MLLNGMPASAQGLALEVAALKHAVVGVEKSELRDVHTTMCNCGNCRRCQKLVLNDRCEYCFAFTLQLAFVGFLETILPAPGIPLSQSNGLEQQDGLIQF